MWMYLLAIRRNIAKAKHTECLKTENRRRNMSLELLLIFEFELFYDVHCVTQRN